MRVTWYVLEDGTAVDPADVSPDESGKLMHKSGVAVAMRGDVPSSRGVDPEEERAKSAAAEGDAREGAKKGGADKSSEHTKDMKPEENAKRPYRTRETKAD